MNFHNAFSLFVAVSATAAFAAPDVTNVQMSQNAGNCKVTITYTLSEPAVVTLDILTNATPNAAAGWASIGGEHICNAQGDVWKKIETAGTHTITWQPAESWLDEYGDGFKVADGCAKARVSAWPLDNTPDYMVVDISAAAQPNTQRYYPRVDFLPGSVLGQKGAVTNNPNYKTSMLVMRKIMAKDVTWTMGSASYEPGRSDQGATVVREATHEVSLANNYYIGVFEITQGQWKYISPNSGATATFSVERWERPMETLSFNELRLSSGRNPSAADIAAHDYPNPPHSDSFLGLLRTKTGLDFDLPSEAQWEFAARAGNGSPYWGDGTEISSSMPYYGMNPLGRHSNSTAITGNSNTTPATTAPADGGTAIVGSYKPNNWGLYDTAGNISEWCLDQYKEDISALAGAICTGSTNGNRINRGGNWSQGASLCRPARRAQDAPGTYGSLFGLRVVCTAGLR